MVIRKIGAYSAAGPKFSARKYPAKEAGFNKPAKNNLQRQKAAWAIALGAGALAATAVVLGIRHSSIRNKAGKKILDSAQIKLLRGQIKEFAQDIPYRKRLLGAMGIKEKNDVVLRSVIGPQEYKSILSEFSSSQTHYSPGGSLITKLQDNFDTSNIDSCDFRANLHTHTTYSDGRMSVQSLLDQAAQYADKVAEKIKTTDVKAKHAPFTIAITDHDTLEGCKEAVKIISEDPWKYRNLRVVLGCELTVENQSIPQRLKSPVGTHVLLHAINPFDFKLNSLLDTKKANRIKLIQEIIDKSKAELLGISPDSASKLGYEDARGLYPILKHGLTHVDLSTKDYIQFRTIFSECFEKNPEIQKALRDKGISAQSLSYITPKEQYFKEINGNFGDNYWERYQKALIKYTAKLLGITEDEASKKIVVTEQMQRFFSDVQRISIDTKPKHNLGPAFIDMEEAIEFIKNQQYGYMGIAHPGLMNIGQYLENPFESMQAMSDVFRVFKEKAGDRGLFAEGHYHYYGPTSESHHWLNSIQKYIEDSGLLKSGGLDSHGKSPFYNYG